MLLLTKIIITATGLWWLALVLLFVFPVSIFSGYAVILSVPIAIVLMILTLIALIKERRKLWPVGAAALILAIVFIALPRIMYWGALAHVYVHQRAYQTTAQRMIAAKDDAERKNICGEECWLLDRDRVAFHYVHGFLNWHDIIYDPSGKVLALKSWDERKQFDMYFISAEHLTGDWYLGHFGD
jgi:hypothetical protein